MSHEEVVREKTDQWVPFLFKVKAVKTRSHQDKDYFAFRSYIPGDAVKALNLADEDYVYVKAQKARWYQMLQWKEMPETYNMLPDEIKLAINESGMEVPNRHTMPLVASPTRGGTYEDVASHTAVAGHEIAMTVSTNGVQK